MSLLYIIKTVRFLSVCGCVFSREAMEDAGSYPNPDNPSHKIVDVAAGESHTLLLTGNSIQFFLNLNTHKTKRGN